MRGVFLLATPLICPLLHLEWPALLAATALGSLYAVWIVYGRRRNHSSCPCT